MAEKKNKPEYQITWPEGAELKMDPKHLMEIRNSLETQFKLMIYKQPGFKFFPSLGNTNFFQHFRTNDGIDFGVCHLYWDTGKWNESGALVIHPQSAIVGDP